MKQMTPPDTKEIPLSGGMVAIVDAIVSIAFRRSPRSGPYDLAAIAFFGEFALTNAAQRIH